MMISRISDSLRGMAGAGADDSRRPRFLSAIRNRSQSRKALECAFIEILECGGMTPLLQGVTDSYAFHSHANRFMK
jgi:hypothetical protein